MAVTILGAAPTNIYRFTPCSDQNISPIVLAPIAASLACQLVGPSFLYCYRHLSHYRVITVTYDHDAALATLDRGYDTSDRLVRTSTDLLGGVTVAPAVIGHGVVSRDSISDLPPEHWTIGEEVRLC